MRGLTAGGDQYRPGYGFGDENHNHTGPPGLSGKGGEKTPPAQTELELATGFLGGRADGTEAKR